MITFREIVYAVLDLLKERSDDAYYTEEHVMFFLKNLRAYLLESKYSSSKRSAFSSVSDSNAQIITLHLEPVSVVDGLSEHTWLKSKEQIPAILGISHPVMCSAKSLPLTKLTFIPEERMPYVGYNKWLKNIIYASKSYDDHLYLRSNNPQYIYLDQVKLQAVFVDPMKVSELNGTDDIMDEEFPLEDSLVSLCISEVVSALLGTRYIEEDKENNAKDELPGNTTARRQSTKDALKNLLSE